MKVVHLQTTDLGGSYKAVERIHKGLELNGVESKILLRTKHHADSIGEEIIHTPVQKLISRTKNVGNMVCSKGPIATERFGTNMAGHPDVREADVIFLHWVNSFLGYRQVEQLAALDKPVIWVAHDMWNYTGGCHLDAYCGRYTKGCGLCPMLNSGKLRDISARNFERKKEAFRRIILLGPSRWSADCAKKSAIWDQNRIEWIFNPVDDQVFRPIHDKELLRETWGIPKGRKVILFGAVGALNNSAKGLQNLMKALQSLRAEEYRLVVFGNQAGETIEDCPLPVTYLGYIKQEESMAQVYNLADVFLAPSEQESFCYTVGEALACGVPAVGYGVGGIAEQIRHKVNGYLAEYGHPEQLAEGAAYCVSHKMQRVDNHNSLKEIGKKYMELCSELLHQ